MSVRELAARPCVTEDMVQRIIQRIRPVEPQEKKAWCLNHSLAFEFREDGIKGLKELTREIEEKSPQMLNEDFFPGSQSFWLLNVEQRRGFMLDLAGIVYSVTMEGIETSLSPESIFDLRKFFQSYNRAVAGTLVSPVGFFMADHLDSSDVFKISPHRQKKMFRLSKNNPCHAIFFGERFSILPEAVKQFILWTATLEFINRDIIPASLRLAQSLPQYFNQRAPVAF